MKADYTARVEKVGRDGRARPRPDLELRRHVAIKVLPSPIPSGCSTIQARLKLRQIAAHSVASEELARRCWRSDDPLEITRESTNDAGVGGKSRERPLI
jgi:hypothetical protein